MSLASGEDTTHIATITARLQKLRRRWLRDRIALPPGTESAVVAEPQSLNYLLASLPAADFGLLRPHLKTEELVGETILFETGDNVDRVYFPHTAIVSLVVNLSTGEMIEAAMVGRDGVVNGLVALGGQPISLCRAVVPMGGARSVIDLDELRAHFGPSQAT